MRQPFGVILHHEHSLPARRLPIFASAHHHGAQRRAARASWATGTSSPTFPLPSNAVRSMRLSRIGRTATAAFATTFTFREGGFDGKVKRYCPRGFVRDTRSNAIWGMQFIWPIKADYRIVYVSPDYQRTIVGREKRDNVWIMARTPQIPAADFQDLRDRVAREGYDMTKLATGAATVARERECAAAQRRGGVLVKIAVIGSGIAGNVAAYHLSREHDITVFEAASHVGGHTHTHDIEHEDQTVAVDTGFIVCNDRNYPNFLALMAELGVELQPSEMSFSVQTSTGLEYNGTTLNSLFAQRRNLLRPGFWRMIRDILRFNREAPRLLESPDDSLRLGDYLDAQRLFSAVRRALHPAHGRRHLERGHGCSAQFPGALLRALLPQPRHVDRGRPPAMAHGARRIRALRREAHAPVSATASACARRSRACAAAPRACS